MKSWLSVDESKPSAPGHYWTRTDLKKWTDAEGILHTNYRSDWLQWDGANWIGGNPTHFYSEKERVGA